MSAIDFENLLIYLKSNESLEIHRACVSTLDKFSHKSVEVRKEFYNNCMNKASEMINLFKKENIE
jgi:hypothetical protein